MGHTPHWAPPFLPTVRTLYLYCRDQCDVEAPALPPVSPAPLLPRLCPVKAYSPLLVPVTKVWWTQPFWEPCHQALLKLEWQSSGMPCVDRDLTAPCMRGPLTIIHILP